MRGHLALETGCGLNRCVVHEVVAGHPDVRILRTCLTSSGDYHPITIFPYRRASYTTTHQAVLLSACTADIGDGLGHSLFLAWVQAFIKDWTSFYITRAFVGACEGGVIPGVVLFATYFYKSKELSIRLASFWSTLNIARVISALLAAAILNMRGVDGKPG